jgi:chorismate synthase
MNTIGRLFRVSVLGESHGPAVGCLIDGCPPGLALSPGTLEADLGRRRAGSLSGGSGGGAGGSAATARHEADEPEIISGVYGGKTTGTPILILFRNADTISSDYEAFRDSPRPGHADFTGKVRYRGFADPRGGGHFSGRLTVGLVAAGAVAKLLLPGCRFETRLAEVGGQPWPGPADTSRGSALDAAMAAGDSVGGVVEVRVSGLPAGLGEPFFGSVESLVSEAVFAVPGIRGIEFGDGFAAARMRGSEHNDPFVGRDGATPRNGAGGVNGGVTNGNDLVFRAAVKPTSTIAAAQSTLDFSTGKMARLEGKGRHDACIAFRAAVAIEAASAIALADLALIARSYDAASGGKA